VEFDDYRHSGFRPRGYGAQRRHAGRESQYESFALSNVVPQDADDNRHLWADIKLAVRELVLAGGDTV
jgi:endonuclease G